MAELHKKSCTAFQGCRRVASGDLSSVARKVKEIIGRDEQSTVLIFDDQTSEIIEIDFRGTVEDVHKRVEDPEAEPEPVSPKHNMEHNRKQRVRGPGRPKLGVVSREVTLMPRHWDWLNSQPGGASVALRKLVEEARRINIDRDKARNSQEATYRFISAMAGDLAGFEEVTRALFAGDSESFNSLMESWPSDIREHACMLAETLFRNKG